MKHISNSTRSECSPWHSPFFSLMPKYKRIAKRTRKVTYTQWCQSLTSLLEVVQMVVIGHFCKHTVACCDECTQNVYFFRCSTQGVWINNTTIDKHCWTSFIRRPRQCAFCWSFDNFKMKTHCYNNNASHFTSSLWMRGSRLNRIMGCTCTCSLLSKFWWDNRSTHQLVAWVANLCPEEATGDKRTRVHYYNDKDLWLDSNATMLWKDEKIKIRNCAQWKSINRHWG